MYNTIREFEDHTEMDKYSVGLLDEAYQIGVSFGEVNGDLSNH